MRLSSLVTPALAALLGFASGARGQEPPPIRSVELRDGLIATLDGVRLSIHAKALAEEDWDALAARALLDDARGPALEGAAGGARLTEGMDVELPAASWPMGLGASALLALFPGDSVAPDGWHHRVTPRATAWSLAALFTGSGANHSKLVVPEGGFRVGAVVVIPRELLMPRFQPEGGGDLRAGRPQAAPAVKGRDAVSVLADLARRTVAAARAAQPTSPPPADEGPMLPEECGPIDDESEPPAPAPAPRESAEDAAFVPKSGTRSDDGLLRYDVDEKGPYAAYKLKQGERLYSDVVLRFTGLLGGRDVNAAALRFAARSGIENVTSIPVGTEVRIPPPDLLPQYLPKGHPRRVRGETEQAEAHVLARRERRKNLSGVHVVLDSGHGGNDPGAGNAIAWEDDHAYDIACRMMAVLRERTEATVHPLVRDRSSGEAPLARLKRDDDEDLLTTPPIALTDIPTKVAVNLRWMMANSRRRELLDEKVPDDRMVFISIHADSLHESATGTMAYYPSAQLRLPSCDVPPEAPYHLAMEANADNAFSMTRREALRSEGLSHELGDAIVASVRSAGLAVHGFGPVRGSIQRGTLMVPAVLRYNRIPASVLIEACNLNNPKDQRSLRDPVFRQKLAEAIVEGLVRYFEGRDVGAARARGRR